MNIVKVIKELRLKLLIKMYSCIPVKKNKIIMWSNSFKSYGCNPKYITEYILENYPGEFDIVWVIDSCLSVPCDIPDSVRVVRYFSKEYLYELHTAHFVICNTRTNPAYYWSKRKGQIYIQTWHSSIRLKTIEKDAMKSLSERYAEEAKADSDKIDYIISGCAFSSRIFKESFWYDGCVLECGTPRIDFLLERSNSREILKKMNLSEEYRYILYAPTFRGDDNYEYNFDFEKLADVCEKYMGGKWKVLYRLHPNLIFTIKEHNISDVCIDVCSYSDMQELIAVSDLMVTDYSSCMFDMMYIKKPCILYMPDFEDYTEKERALYFNIKELPFLKAYTEAEIFDAIENFDEKKYEADTVSFLEKIGSFENGTACKTIADLIVEKRKNKGKRG